MNQLTHKEKICTLCGHDCSTRSRMRDRHGHYYCTSCYERARERRHRSTTAGSSPTPAPEPAPMPAPMPTRPEPPDFWREFEAHGHQMLCPGCGAPQLPAAVLCTGCGRDARTGRRREPIAEAPAAPLPEPALRFGKWDGIIERQEADAAQCYRRELLVAAGMLIVGYALVLGLLAAQFDGGRAVLAAAGYTVTLGIEVVVGVAALWIASRLWLGGAGPVGPAALRLAAIYVVVDTLALLLAPLLAIALVVQVLVYLALLAWQFELDFRDAVMLGFLTFALKLGVAVALAGALAGIG